MIIVGGTYIEECDWPERKLLMGPGSRAALAISKLSVGSELYTSCYPADLPDLKATMSSAGIKAHIQAAQNRISFFYKHPLTSPPQQEPIEVGVVGPEPWQVSGKTVLAFGLLEARASVSADRAVFEVARGSENILRADVKSLALIAGENDLPEHASVDDPDVVAKLMTAWNAELMIVRRLAGGAVLYHGESRFEVPAYAASEWFKIGAGNVFCATFAHYWGEKKFDPKVAADLASRNSANYAGTKALPVDEDALLPMEVFNPIAPCKIFVASPCFSMAQQWLLDQAIVSLRELGVEVISPYNLGLDGVAVGDEEITSVFDGCHAVLVLAEGSDVPSVLAVGLARVRRLPIVILAEEVKQRRLELWQGTDCEVAQDFASAVYRVMVAGRRTARP